MRDANPARRFAAVSPPHWSFLAGLVGGAIGLLLYFDGSLAFMGDLGGRQAMALLQSGEPITDTDIRFGGILTWFAGHLQPQAWLYMYLSLTGLLRVVAFLATQEAVAEPLILQRSENQCTVASREQDPLSTCIERSLTIAHRSRRNVSLRNIGFRTCGLLLAVGLAACGGQPGSVPTTGASSGASQGAPLGGPLSTQNMDAVQGQQATCAGPRDKVFDLDVIETSGVDLGLGTSFAAWTYNGRIPGPTIEVCEGDTVTINVHNRGETSHGLDTHAFKIDARSYGPTPPGTTLTMEKAVDTPGVFMYHCAAGPVTDLHIKSGIHGAMIVYPRDEQLRPAREIVVVEDAVFGQRDEQGFIPGTDPAMTEKNQQLFSMFNGRLDNAPVPVQAGDLVRMYFVNIGPWPSSAHVIGAIFDRVYDGQSTVEGVQTYLVPAGGGAIFEFYIPEAGVFPFVDHDKLAFLPWGLALVFSAE